MGVITIVSIFLGILLALALLFYLFYRFYFLRNPIRSIPQGENIVSPADGRIVRILKIDLKKSIDGGEQLLQLDKGLFGRVKTMIADVSTQCYVIQIMLTPFDIHYQRAPLAGRIVSVLYTKGKFFNAVKNPEKLRCLSNEKNEILFEAILKKKKIRVKVIQIAGVLARRIVCFVKTGDYLNKGQHIGVITLGSQVSLVIPTFCTLHVRERQYVYGGSTVIAS